MLVISRFSSVDLRNATVRTRTRTRNCRRILDACRFSQDMSSYVRSFIRRRRDDTRFGHTWTIPSATGIMSALTRLTRLKTCSDSAPKAA